MNLWERLFRRAKSSSTDRYNGDSASSAPQAGLPSVPPDPLASSTSAQVSSAVSENEARARKPAPARGHSSWTPLHLAARHGDKQAVEFLLEQAVEINARSSINETPLFLTLEHKDVAELLLANGADPDIQRSDGWAPLHWAVHRGHKDVVELLLRNNSQVNALGMDSRTPLHMAMGRRDIAELLLASGADVNAKMTSAIGRGWTPFDGWTPLHLAAQHGDREMVELLVAYGADVHASANLMLTGPSTRGLTPLHLAVQGDHKEVVEVLLADGSDVHRKLEDGRTSLHLTSSKEMAALLLAAGHEPVPAPALAPRRGLL